MMYKIHLPSVSTHASKVSYRFINLAAMIPARPIPLPSSKKDRFLLVGSIAVVADEEVELAVRSEDVTDECPKSRSELSLSKSHIFPEPNLKKHRKLYRYLTHTFFTSFDSTDTCQIV